MSADFQFRLVLRGPEVSGDLAATYAAHGCSDALLGQAQGSAVAEFNRNAPGFEEAVVTAIRHVEAVGVHIVVRVEPDDLVTAGGIASRTGRSRQSIAQLASGQRGAGDFPTPVSTADGRTRIWRWSDVRAWFAERSAAPEEVRQASFVAAINGALDMRSALKTFQRQGGSPAAARAVARIGRDPIKTPGLAKESRPTNATTRLSWPSDTDRQVARFFDTGPKGWSDPSSRIGNDVLRMLGFQPAFADPIWLEPLATYTEALDCRRQGDIRRAVQFDCAVLEQTRARLIHTQGPAVPPRYRAAGAKRSVATPDRLWDLGSELLETASLVAPDNREALEASPAAVECLSYLLALTDGSEHRPRWRRIAPVVGGRVAAVASAARTTDRVPDPSRMHASGGVPRSETATGGFVSTNAPQWVALRDAVKSRDDREVTTEDALVSLLVSSWTLASAARIVGNSGPAAAIQEIDATVSLLERELSAWAE